jgi:SAM-dependent methyltransferase
MINYATAYREIHRNPKRFPGFSVKAYLDAIAALVKDHETKTILDFGCGKARGYLDRNYHKAWGGILPTLYDIGVPQFAKKPVGRTFGGVINTDMLEHIHERDVANILDELIGFVEPGGWLFLGVSCRPANKSFKGGVLDGQNMHLTVQPPGWWRAKIGAAQHRNDRWNDIHIVAHWDIDGHFDEPEVPWDSRA